MPEISHRTLKISQTRLNPVSSAVRPENNDPTSMISRTDENKTLVSAGALPVFASYRYASAQYTPRMTWRAVIPAVCRMLVVALLQVFALQFM